jgi:hypothetical protein
MIQISMKPPLPLLLAGEPLLLGEEECSTNGDLDSDGGSCPRVSMA